MNFMNLGARNMGRLQRAARVSHLEVRFARVDRIENDVVCVTDTVTRKHEIPLNNFSKIVNPNVGNMIVIQYNRFADKWNAIRDESDKMKI